MKKVFLAMVLFLSSCEVPLEFNITVESWNIADGGTDLICDYICPQAEDVCGYEGCWVECDKDPLVVGACYLQNVVCSDFVLCLEGKESPDGGV